MEEKSFLLFKPNIFHSTDVYKYILDELKDNGLNVDNKYSQHLSAWQICKLWPRQSKDRLLYYTISELFKDAIKIIEVSGDGAIAMVNKIKEKVRFKYANSIFRNCVHAPINSQEYNSHIEVLRNKRKNLDLSFAELPYNSYKKLTEELCGELAEFIVDLSLYALIHFITPYYISTNRFRYYLIDDESHSFTEHVCFICDYFQQYNFRDATVLATILITHGEVCLIDGNDERGSKEIIQNGIKHNITIKRHEIT